MNIIVKITPQKLLFLVVILATTLRFYQLGIIPPSISWDEAAVGYNAWTVSHSGYDESGKLFPAVFKSFGDDKHPVHVYFTALSAGILGLSEFSTRLPSAVFGVLNVIIVFYLGRIIFSSGWVGLFASLFLAVSPYSLQFSRFNHEANFALFFLMLGLWLFLKGVKDKNILLSFSFLSFGLSFLTYHSAELVVPGMILVLMIMFWKNLLLQKAAFLLGIVFITLFIGIIIQSPALLGAARIQQTTIDTSVIEKTVLYQQTKNNLLGRGEVVFNQYLLHFTSQYLFETGDKNNRHSSQSVGEFYKIDALFLILGLLFLINNLLTNPKKRQLYSVILTWALLAPLPASLAAEAPHAARSLFMMGSWHLIAGFGLYALVQIFKNTKIKMAAAGLCLTFLGVLLWGYLQDYYQNYPVRSATEWQYGMKQIVQFIKDHPEYTQIYMTDVRHQPYIFFLYYLKTPLLNFLSTVKYNQGESQSYNLVSFYDKYHFGDWDPIESLPEQGKLYIIEPSSYDGLRYKAAFKVKETVYLPNKSAAFYLVSVN